MKQSLSKIALAAAVLACIGVVFGVSVTTSSADETGQIVGQLDGSRRLLQHAVVYVDQAPGNYRAPRRPIEMDQINHEFRPRALPVVRGATVRFLNNDNEAHNVFTPDNEGYDLGSWTGGESKDHTFSRLGVYTQLCRLHPSMIAYVLVLQNPFFDGTNSRGRFRIRNVPPGTYQLKAWQERGRGSVEVTVTAGETTEVTIPMRRGRS